MTTISLDTFNIVGAASLSGRTEPTKLPASVKKLLIVGGGSAGWLTALVLQHWLKDSGVVIELLESPVVGIIGVGEGSTPTLRSFFDLMEIDEAEWMPACNATYKAGITFDKWSSVPGFESYFHPFSSVLDNVTARIFIQHVEARVRGVDIYAHPDRFFVSHRVAVNGLAPKAPIHFPFDIQYGYHFDAALLGQFLQKKAIARGILHKTCHVEAVNLNETGDISTVVTRDGETIAADFFVDCSGFNGLLIQQALKTPYVSFASNLFNDAAIAMPTEIGDFVPSQTVSTAFKHGWSWKIPLMNRFGNGYVYSTGFCSADQAETELRTHLGLLDADVPARHLKMKIGRVSKHWNRNCVAIGLSQGFIEPLEATGLGIIQDSAMMLGAFLAHGDLGESAQKRYNEHVNTFFDSIRDYIVTHYATNSRSDTEYWRANKSHNDYSDSLRELYAKWTSGQSVVDDIKQGRLSKTYPVHSWFSLFAGMGIFPAKEGMRQPNKEESLYKMEDVDSLIARSASNFIDHRAYLRDIDRQPQIRNLQIYPWGQQ